MSNDTRLEAMDDKFWEEFEDIRELKASNNKLLPCSGVGFVYGSPASSISAIVIDTIKTMEDFNEYLYVDSISKTAQQAKDTYKSISKLGWKYFNTILQGAGSKDVVSLIKTLERNSVVIIDNWHQMLSAEGKNHKGYAKKAIKALRTVALKNDLLIVINNIEEESNASDDATFKVLVSKNKKGYKLEVTKDSIGMLTSSTATIAKGIIKYEAIDLPLTAS